MAYFEDLSGYSFFSRYNRAGTKNVGWLEQGRRFETATPSQETLDLLWEFCSIAVVQTRGIHRCDLCTLPVMVAGQRNGVALHLGSAEIRVFSNIDGIYAAPNLIYHYVDTHHYRPPDEFLQAMKDGPKPPSLEYFEQLNQIDPDWREQFTEHALQTYLELAKASPAYLPYVARVLISLGFSYRVNKLRQQEEEAFEQATQIYRELCTLDPKYLPNLAKVLNILGDLYANTRRLDKAEQATTEALAAYRELATSNAGFLIFMRQPLKRLRTLYSAAGRHAEAIQAEEEDSKIDREILNTKPEIPWH